MRALNERLKKEQDTHDEANDENWPSIDDETSKNEADAKDAVVDLENSSSCEGDAEIIDKKELEEN